MSIGKTALVLVVTILLAGCTGKKGGMAADCQELATLGADICECLAEKTADDLSREEFAQVISLTVGKPGPREAAQADSEKILQAAEGQAVSVLVEALAACGIGIQTDKLP